MTIVDDVERRNSNDWRRRLAMMEGIEGVSGIFINAIMGSRRQYYWLIRMTSYDEIRWQTAARFGGKKFKIEIDSSNLAGRKSK